MTTRKAYLSLMLGAFIISFAPVFARLVQMSSGDAAAMGPTAAAFYRTLIGGIFLWGVLLIQKKKLFNVSKKVFYFAGLGALFFAFDLTAWHRSIVLVGPGLAALLASFQVFILTLVGFFFLNEKPSLIQWIAIPFALLGLSLIVGLDFQNIDDDYLWGIILGLITACCYAGYVLSLRGANKEELRHNINDPIRIMAIASLLTAGFLLIFTYGLGESFSVEQPIHWLWLILLGIFCQAIAWVLISRSLPYVRAAHVGLIILLQPIFAFVWDILIFARGITNIELLGAVITVIAIYFGSVNKSTE